MSPTAACDAPPFDARTTDFIGHFWSVHDLSRFPTITTMPLPFASESTPHEPYSHLSAGMLASPSTRFATGSPEGVKHDTPITGTEESATQRRENTRPIETSLPLLPHRGTASQLYGAFTSRSRAVYHAGSFVRTALPLLMQNDLIESLSTNAEAPNPLASTLARDSLLIYAHRIFNSFSNAGGSGLASHEPDNVASPGHPYNSQLLPLLQRLRTLHPRHLPTLLLLGCVHYALGNLEESLAVNNEILRIDASFVEAMSNLATTLKAMGRTEDAVQWWWKAIYLKPDFWDAVNNLLGTLVAVEQDRNASLIDKTYNEPLRLCESVQSRLVGTNGEVRISILPRDLHHLQNIYYVSGSIRCMSGQEASFDGLSDFVSSIEVLLHTRGTEASTHYDFKDFLLAGSISGLIVSSCLPDPIAKLALEMDYPELSYRTGATSCNLLEFVKRVDDKLWQMIMTVGDGTFPAIFASPEQASNTFNIMFQGSLGIFPTLCTWSESGERLEKPTENVTAKTCELASNVLLSIAKLVQESRSATIRMPKFDAWIHAGPPLMLLLYYLAYSIFPSPSTCNNLGIVLSTTPWMDARALNAVSLAKAFYNKGLELDPYHAHLLTNMGSLLKEAGDLDAAIDMYERSVQANPSFDVALANLANALKDSGRLSESISFYRRAVEANEDLPEALCGLAHAAWSICDWRGFGRIDAHFVIDAGANMLPRDHPGTIESGWMPRLIHMTQKQLSKAYHRNVGLVKTTGSIDDWTSWIEEGIGTKLPRKQRNRWVSYLVPFFATTEGDREGLNEGSFMIRVVEWLTRHLQWRWYIDAFGNIVFTPVKLTGLNADAIRRSGNTYSRPHLPSSMSAQLSPSVLPFHTFIYPLNAREIRLVAHRNALHVSHVTLTRTWLPEHVYPPPPPPGPRINVGYVSSDFNDHPTAHLISSVFSMHDGTKFSVFAYALSGSDHSTYRGRIEQGVHTFRDVSSWSTQAIVEQIVRDEVHILVNLNGYTKGARNDIFAARPCPIQVSFLGFAGTLASSWCDYLVCDPIACPPTTRPCEFCDVQQEHGPSKTSSDISDDFDHDLGPDPDSMAGWKYVERLIYMPHTYLVTDHKQCYGSEARGLNGTAADPKEQWKSAEVERRRLKRILFPDLFDETIIFANFNQMYKLDPSIFATWLRILKRVPNSILWLLRFPPAAEEHLLRTAAQWAGASIASRVRFTNVVTKDEHINRACVADIFLDTVECNAHTVAAECVDIVALFEYTSWEPSSVLWSGTPIITWPKYTFKMCSRVGASIAFATGFGQQMVVDSLAAYEERAVSLALSSTPSSFRSGRGATRHGELADLRRNLFLKREVMPLFDCRRWTRNLEKAYVEIWKRWVRGGTTVHYNVEGGTEHGYERCNGFVWVRDGDI